MVIEHVAMVILKVASLFRPAVISSCSHSPTGPSAPGGQVLFNVYHSATYSRDKNWLGIAGGWPCSKPMQRGVSENEGTLLLGFHTRVPYFIKLPKDRHRGQNRRLPLVTSLCRHIEENHKIEDFWLPVGKKHPGQSHMD